VVIPRIEDMDATRQRLLETVPELSVRQAHGKMPAAEIDSEMLAFADGDGDVLLATNIIEAGLDVPRANTMIVLRSDRFGLAQLHQLRGRVGRGGRRAQVILFTEPGTTLSAATLKRLKTLETLDRLGAGFEISARDLDLRGAGDLLGEEQAGHMRLIGADLYQHMLAAALKSARGAPTEQWTPELNVEAAGQLPGEWIPDADIRIALYCRLARLETQIELDAFEDELEDRFGAIPKPAEALLLLSQIRVAAHATNIVRIDAGPEAIAFTPRNAAAGADLAGLGLSRKADRFILAEAISHPLERLRRVHEMLDRLPEP
jgi:transcription-repair coupling factor (superfamily II helicase)